MCSIIGYKGKFQPNFVSKLLDESRLRGVHAFGFHTKKGTKKFLEYTDFKQELLAEKPELFLAHFRYSTSGDYKEQENNQPLTEGKISLVFNGVISQADKTTMEEKFNTKLPSDNDGWLFFSQAEFEFAQAILSLPNISFACVMTDGQTLKGLRNHNRPLWAVETSEFLVIASTKDILSRSGIKGAKPLKKNSVYEW